MSRDDDVRYESAVIDGQQRLTTLQVVLAAARAVAEQSVYIGEANGDWMWCGEAP